MVKLGIVSDLHAETWTAWQHVRIGSKLRHRLRGADLILLAGDIDNGPAAVETAEGLFPTVPVCLVAGNHEFYDREYHSTMRTLAAMAASTPNIHFLNRDCHIAIVQGRQIRVLGATLWTDFRLGPQDRESAMAAAERGVPDYQMIMNRDALLRPQDTAEWHAGDWAWLRRELAYPFDGSTVVLVHHAPVSFAGAPVFINSPISPAYASRLEHEFWRWRVDAVVWGHTHYPFDAMLGRTRLISSPTGFAVFEDTVETDCYGTIIEI